MVTLYMSHTLIRAYGICLCTLGVLYIRAPILASCCVYRIMQGVYPTEELFGLPRLGLKSTPQLKGFTVANCHICSSKKLRSGACVFDQRLLLRALGARMNSKIPFV